MTRNKRPKFQPIDGGTALITGATSGIGAEFATQLAARGCPMVLVARSRDKLEETAARLTERHGVACEVLVADLSTREGVERVRARLLDAARPVDILVNNAGSGLHSSVLAEDVSDHERAFDLMIRAVFQIGNAAGRAMEARDRGLIVNVASVSGFVNMGNYSAIKAWVRRWSASLANELYGTGVQVMTLNPGWVRTEFHQRSGVTTSNIPDFLWLNVRDLVSSCLRDVDAGRTTSIPSARFKVIAALAHHGPQSVVDVVARRINKGRRSDGTPRWCRRSTQGNRRSDSQEGHLTG